MAERASVKAKRASQDVAIAALGSSGRRKTGGAQIAPADADAQGRALERERDNLKAELEVARAQIALLEQQREQFVNRIDWMMDSLQGLLEEKR